MHALTSEGFYPRNLGSKQLEEQLAEGEVCHGGEEKLRCFLNNTHVGRHRDSLLSWYGGTLKSIRRAHNNRIPDCVLLSGSTSLWITIDSLSAPTTFTELNRWTLAGREHEF